MTNVDRIYVKPRAILGPDGSPTGEVLVVRDEYTLEPIPAAGGWVNRTRLVERRLRGGDMADLIACKAPPEPTPAPEQVDAPAEPAPQAEAAPAPEQAPEQPARRRGKSVEPSTESEG